MEKTKKCPYCGEEILAVARKCKHCGEWLGGECPECHEWVSNDSKNCPNCGNPITILSADSKCDALKDEALNSENDEKKEQNIITEIKELFLGALLLGAIIGGIYYFMTQKREKNRIEKEQTQLIEQQKHANDIENSIALYAISVSTPDKDGNVETLFDIENVSSKTIKYITIFGFYVNSFGDQVNDNVTKQKEYTWRLTGPMKPNVRDVTTQHNSINNETVDNIWIRKIVVEYTDDSKVTIEGSEELNMVCKWANS